MYYFFTKTQVEGVELEILIIGNIENSRIPEHEKRFLIFHSGSSPPMYRKIILTIYFTQ